MSTPRRAAIVLNASAGVGINEEALKTLVQGLAADAYEVVVMRAESGAELAQFAQQAVTQKNNLIVAAGGDGTLSTVAATLIESQTTLGVLPWGTLNHFAKDCGIPLDPEAAIQTIRQGQVTQVDVGEVNGQVFINNSSLGLYAHAVRQRDAQRKRWGRGKLSAFFWASLHLLRLFPILRVTLTCDGKRLERRTPFVFIGNNEYTMEGIHMATRASLQAGHLSLYMSHGLGRWRLFRFAFLGLIGRLRQARDFDALTAREILVETRRPRLRVALDGEVTSLNTPLHYRLRPAALRVLVPIIKAPR